MLRFLFQQILPAIRGQLTNLRCVPKKNWLTEHWLGLFFSFGWKATCEGKFLTLAVIFLLQKRSWTNPERFTDVLFGNGTLVLRLCWLLRAGQIAV